VTRLSRIRLKISIALAAIACLAGVACSGTNSDSVDTKKIFAELTASAAITGRTEVSAALRISGPILSNQVRLVEGDLLRATRIDPITLTEDDQVMTRSRGAVTISYSTVFSSGEKDTGFEVALDRSQSGRVSAIDSRVTLPAPFVLDWVDDPVAMTPAPNPFSRRSSTPYFVIWDPFDAPDFDPGDELHYEVTGSCIQALEGSIDWESGEDVLQLTGVLQDQPPPNDGLSCLLELKFSLRRAGVLDPAFAGGSMVGEQVRYLVLQSPP